MQNIGFEIELKEAENYSTPQKPFAPFLPGVYELSDKTYESKLEKLDLQKFITAQKT